LNHSILLEQPKNLKSNPQLKRKLKIFLGVGLAGILMVGALVVWAGIATFKSVASIGTNPAVQEKIVGLETGIKNLPALTKVGCWTTAQSLMKVEVWIEKPLIDNLNSLKLACLNK
jgi:hypothetical protein